MLGREGFEKVYNLKGGIKAWNGEKATSPVDFHLQFVRGDESPLELAKTAYRMEEGLKRFYLTMKERTGEEDLAHLFGELSGYEDKHQRNILTLARELGFSDEETEEIARTGEVEVLEGGYEFEKFLAENEEQLSTAEGVLDTAMTVEVQALDLYLRMAQPMDSGNAREILHRISDEEKAHVEALGRKMEEYVEKDKR
jgi:rubrerythrin